MLKQINRFAASLSQSHHRSPQDIKTPTYSGIFISRNRLRQPRYLLLSGMAAVVAVSCTQLNQTQLVTEEAAPAGDEEAVLTVWWEKGFNLEEDEAMQNLVDAWQEDSNHMVDLSFYTTDDLLQKAQRAIQAGNPPDILMSHNAERGLYPYQAWEGKLVDVSEIVEPLRTIYPPSILEAVYFYNNVEKKRSYYSVPFSQTTNFINYWSDFVEQAGFEDKAIPQDWDGFWNFWKQVQEQLPQPQNQDTPVYGLGFSFSDKAADTYLLFEQILEAYDAQLVTPEGELQVEDPVVRQKIIQSLDWYAQFYQDGYLPMDTVNWLNPDNNGNLLNRAIVMTPNTSLTIPATVRKEADVYQNQLSTIGFPDKPSGAPMRHILSIKQAVIFTDSENQDIAKEFLAYFVQPETVGNYLKAAGLRNMPIAKTIWEDPYWTNPDDPHIAKAAELLLSDNTRPFPSVYHPAYSIVTKENVWGQALNRMVTDDIAAEQAADDAIARITQIFDDFAAGDRPAVGE
ncbi:MAG: extracellular solute-binding protein [Leptolyngbyaceae cyanobacterium]